MIVETITQQILAKTPVKEVEDLRKVYEDKGYGPRTFVKGLRPEKQIRQKVGWSVHLGLEKLYGLYTLDIGTGAGWFPYILKYLGHNVEMSDIPDGASSEAYERNINILGMKKTHSFYVRKAQPLPEAITLNKYDLISATGVAFHEKWDKWNWLFFITGCMDIINPDGRLFLQINNTGKAEEGYEGFLDCLSFTDFPYEYECMGYLTWIIYK